MALIRKFHEYEIISVTERLMIPIYIVVRIIIINGGFRTFRYPGLREATELAEAVFYGPPVFVKYLPYIVKLRDY